MRPARILLVLPLVLSILVAAPPAMSRERARPSLKCLTGVVGVDSSGHVRVDSVRNDRVKESGRSSATLPSTVTAWGLYDTQDTKRGQILRLDAVTADGTPRRVTLNLRDGKVGVDSSRYDQTDFAPRLFADGYGSYAYTVSDSGELERYTLTRFGNGDLRFADKVTVGGGYGDLTSLQSSMSFFYKGVEREYLYATTTAGALKQIAVPVRRPGKEKVRTLKDAGYTGVTELSWSTCNGKDTFTSLIAIDPVANTATWTTVRDAITGPRAKLRGAVTGGTDWNLSAVY